MMQIIGGLKKVEYVHLWPCAVLTAFLMLLSGCMSADQARRSIYWGESAAGREPRLPGSLCFRLLLLLP